MPQLTVTGAPVPLQSPTGAPIVGQNLSKSNALYLSELPSCSATDNHAVIGPGGDFTWPGDKQLYAATDAGATIEIVWLNNGATINTGSTLSNLANVPTLIDTVTVNYPVGNAITPFQGLPIDVGNYASVIVECNVSTGTGGTIQITNFLNVSVVFCEDTVFALGNYDFYGCQWLLMEQAQIYNSVYQVPVTRRYFRLSGALQKNLPTPSAGTITFKVYGSNESINQTRYVSAYLAAGGDPGTLTVQQGTLTTSTTYFANLNNAINIYANRASSGTTLEANVEAISQGQAFPILGAQLSTFSTEFAFSLQGFSPPLPLRLVVRTASAASTTNATVTQPR